MRTFLSDLLLKILPESLTWAALLFLLEREGIDGFAPRKVKDSLGKIKPPIHSADSPTASVAF